MATIIDPYLWFKADTLSLNNADKVSIWKDYSVNGFDAIQTDPLFQPIFISAPGLDINNPALQFKNTAVGVASENVAPSTFTVCCVFNAFSLLAQSGLFMKSSDVNWKDGFGAYYDSDTNLFNFFVNDTTNRASTEITENQWYIMSFVFNSDTLFLYKNGTEIKVSSSISSIDNEPNSDLFIGAGSRNSNAPGAFMFCYMPEFIFFDRALNVSEIYSVEGYLGWKYGLTDLLADSNPYKQPGPLSILQTENFVSQVHKNQYDFSVPSKIYTLQNNGGQANWQLDIHKPWISSDISSGTIEVGDSVDIEFTLLPGVFPDFDTVVFENTDTNSTLTRNIVVQEIESTETNVETSHLFSDEEFLFYADYFAYVAKSGVLSSQRIWSAISEISKVDPNSFSVFENAIVAKNNLVVTLRSSYENIFVNAYETNPMQSSFQALSKYILKESGKRLNSYLEIHGLKVLPTYASLSNIFGDEISNINIRES